MVDIEPKCFKNQVIEKESYVITNARMHVGNLIIGERYLEPQGLVTVVNQMTGDYCEINYKARGNWFSS
jgi:hypothetical protein